MPEPLATTRDLDARAAAAAAHHHDVRILWPDTDPVLLRRAEAVLIASLRRLLSGERVALDDAIDAVTCGRAAFRVGIGPLLGRFVEDGALSAPGAVGRLLVEHLEHGRRRYDRLAGEAARLVRLFRAHGIEPVVLKGPAIAALYPECGARPFQDIDLFVAPRDAAQAERLMLREGFRPGPLGAGRRRNWYPPGRLVSLDLAHADNPWSVDLHYGLGRVYHRALVAELPEPDPASCPTMAVGGELVRVLPAAHHAALLSLHVATELYLLQLVRVLDLVYLARRDGGSWWPELPALLAGVGSERFAYPGLSLTERLAPGSVPPDVLARIERAASPRLRRAIRDLPLAGLSRWDRLRPPFLMLWVTKVSEVMLILALQLTPRGYRLRREHRAFRRRLAELHGPNNVRYDVRPAPA